MQIVFPTQCMNNVQFESRDENMLISIFCQILLGVGYPILLG